MSTRREELLRLILSTVETRGLSKADAGYLTDVLIPYIDLLKCEALCEAANEISGSRPNLSFIPHITARREGEDIGMRRAANIVSDRASAILKGTL